MKMGQSVPKRRHIKFRRLGITQKKAYNLQKTAKILKSRKLPAILPQKEATTD